MTYAKRLPWAVIESRFPTDEERAVTRRTHRRMHLRRASSAVGVRQDDRRGQHLDELTVALHTIDDFGRSVQSADTKAGALAAVLGLMAGSLTGDIANGSTALVGGASVRGAAFVVFLASLLISGASLGLTQLPRLTVGDRDCRLSFPSVAARGRRRAGGTPADLRDEAWHQAALLAAIAMTKFRYLRIALFATGTCVLAFLCWLVASAASMS